MSEKTTAKLLYADSERCADMLYLANMFVPDPFLAMDTGRAKVAVMHSLEIARARKVSAFDEVLPLDDVVAATRKALKKQQPRVADMVRWLMGELGVQRLHIASDFPAAIALELKQQRVSLEVIDGGLYPERMYKNADACKEIRKGNAASAAGIRAAESVLRASEVKGSYLYYQDKKLTSERLRQAVDMACLERGAMPAHTIVAGGEQACDPHCEGHGVLRANELIIVDVFPRLTKSGYHGDMTRTFLKGRASDAQKKLVQTVRAAQLRALDKIRAGAQARAVHAAAKDYFDESGYPTEVRKGVPVGFFHSTGHGLGLEVHEAPRLSPLGSKLKKGMVVTVEPGLYYPGLGGCRIEDVVCVTAEGYELLSKYHYKWQIR